MAAPSSVFDFELEENRSSDDEIVDVDEVSYSSNYIKILDHFS